MKEEGRRGRDALVIYSLRYPTASLLRVRILLRGYQNGVKGTRYGGLGFVDKGAAGRWGRWKSSESKHRTSNENKQASNQ